MSEIVNASHLVVGLFALWFLYFFCWREHRIDSYRQRLFGLRDELFDFAASGCIRFDDPAYTTLRNLSNGLIRYAHRVTFTRVLVLLLFGKLPRNNRMELWMEDVKTRPTDVRQKLLKAHEQLSKASAWYVIAWSPFAWICILMCLPIVNILLTVNLLKKRVVQRPRDISAVLEEEALEQSSVEDDCVALV